MKPTWRLSLFGTVGLHSPEISYSAFETKRSAKLLVLLCLSRTGQMRREDLADLLWPEDLIDSTRLRLRQELNRLRRALSGNDAIISTTAELVSLDRSQIENDLERLANSPSLPINDLVAMLAEPFLPGWDDSWVTAKRDEVDQLRVRKAIDTATNLLDQKEPDLALKVLQASKTISPRNEEIRDLTMKVHKAMGSLSDAIGEYRRFQREPAPLKSEPNIATIANQSTDNLQELDLPQPPHPIDQFFGRMQICQELREIIQDRSATRLISLVGTGGIGKTRLAIEALKGIEANHGFISFVECPADDSPEAYLLQVLMPGNNDREPLTSIKRLLQDKASILVLDNLEHLVDPGRFVTSLLSSVSDLRLIVTSRKPMKVAGEHVCKVSPLEKGNEAIPMLAELTGSKRVDAHRAVLYEEIAEMCGGIPLTLRLAAARLRLLEPEELIEELKESTTFLRADLPDLEERHRDLNRMLRLTISSLSQDDATTLLNISNFPGGVTRAIARRMVGSKVDEVLERLLDSALIWLDDDVSPLRFRLLEPIRQFIQEESNDDLILQAKKNLIDQMIVIAETLCDCWNISCDTQDSIYLKERENFRHAIRTALEFDPDKALFLFQRTWTFELPVGQVSELDDISNRLEAALSSDHRALGHIFICRTWCRSGEGKLDEAAALARKSHEHFSEATDEAFSCYALACACEHERYKLSWDEVKRNYDELFALVTTHAPNFLPTLRVWRGTILCIRRDWAAAAQDLEVGYQTSKGLGAVGNQVYAGVALLTIDYASQRFDRMRERLGEMRAVFDFYENRQSLSVFLRAEARVALVEGDFFGAERFSRRGLAVCEITGNHLHAVEIKTSLARSLIAQDRLDEAESIVREMAPAVSYKLVRIAVMALACKAEIRWKQGLFEEAKELLADALAFRDGNKVDTHIMESDYLDELIKIMDLSSWERSISADQIQTLISQ